MIAAIAVAVLLLRIVQAETTISYSLGDRGGVSMITRGGTGTATVGYARIQPNGLNPSPSGLAIFGFRQNGVLVTEAGVPASALIRSGRTYAEVNGPVNTGIAIANPNAQSAMISFSFTDSNGVDFGAGTTTIEANSQIARFLDQEPFNAGSSVNGTFTFTSTAPVSVIALRGLTNERGEFLITTLPVLDFNSPSSGATMFPHFADGGGWTTQVVLVNPTENPMSGSVQFFSQGNANVPGQPLAITANGGTSTSFNYLIPRRSSFRLRTSGGSALTSSGSIRVNPGAGQGTPSGLVVFSFRNGAFTVSEAGVPALRPSTAFRLYAEASGPTGSILTGVGIANASADPVGVSLEITPLIGGLPILSGSMTIPGNGQVARFLNEVQGLESLPRPFKGVLRVATPSAAGITVIGLRSRVNERGDFLITTTPPTDENATPSMNETVFPHFVDNGGYTTQFVMYSGTAGQQAAGSLRMFGRSGQPLDLGMASLADLEVSQTDLPDPVVIEGSLTYAITVLNKGPLDASGVQITDVLPAGVTVESTSGAQGGCSTPSSGLLVCNVGNLSANNRATVNVVVRTGSAGTLMNSVTVSSNDDDPATTNNRHITTTVVAPSADLEITQQGPERCGFGADCEDATYTISILNRGPSAATNVILTDVLPTDPPSGAVVATRKSFTVPQGTCGAVISGRFTCNLGSVAVGTTVNATVVLSIDSTAIGRQIINRTSVSSGDVVDSVSGNESRDWATFVTPTLPETDLEVVDFSPNAPNVTRPNTATFTARIINNGRSTATIVSLVTTFSGQLAMRTATSTQGTCLISGLTVTCNIGTLVKNVQRTVTIVVAPSAAGQVNATTVMSGNPGENDPDRQSQTPNHRKTASITVF